LVLVAQVERALVQHQMEMFRALETFLTQMVAGVAAMALEAEEHPRQPTRVDRVAAPVVLVVHSDVDFPEVLALLRL
jgi:pyrroline-5-carboxylate reductase